MMNTAKSFTSVLDGRKRKVRNLWQRGDRYYARIKIAYPGEDRAKTRREPKTPFMLVGGGILLENLKARWAKFYFFLGALPLFAGCRVACLK